jgi:hypothetical protein
MYNKYGSFVNVSLALEIASYHYEEHGNMRLDGIKYGVNEVMSGAFFRINDFSCLKRNPI